MRDHVLQVGIGDNVEGNQNAVSEAGEDVERRWADSIFGGDWQQYQNSLEDCAKR